MGPGFNGSGALYDIICLSWRSWNTCVLEKMSCSFMTSKNPHFEVPYWGVLPIMCNSELLLQLWNRNPRIDSLKLSGIVVKDLIKLLPRSFKSSFFCDVFSNKWIILVQDHKEGRQSQLIGDGSGYSTGVLCSIFTSHACSGAQASIKDFKISKCIDILVINSWKTIKCLWMSELYGPLG